MRGWRGPSSDSIPKPEPRTSHEYGLSAAQAAFGLSSGQRQRLTAGHGKRGGKEGKVAQGGRRARAGLSGQNFLKLFLDNAAATGRKNDGKARKIWPYRLSHGCCFSRLTRGRPKAYIPPIGALYRKLRLRRRAFETPHWVSENASDSIRKHEFPRRILIPCRLASGVLGSRAV